MARLTLPNIGPSSPDAADASAARRLPIFTLRLDLAEWRVVRWLLPLALLHGLLYLFLLPPWQHYDEPAHFVYAAQIARGGLAAPADPALSREVADSMYRHRFWPAGYQPDLSGGGSVPVGSDQRIHPPLYYAIVAAPLGLARYLPVEQQLYVGRLLSVLIYALAILAAWRVAATLLPDEPMAASLLPLMLLLPPAFADLMSALNSDVLVNFCTIAAFLGCALLLRDGPRPAGLALALLGLSAALLTKRTAAPAALPVALALFWALRRRAVPWSAYLLGGGGAALVVGLVSLQLVTVVTAQGPALSLAPRGWLITLDQGYLRLQLDQWLLSVSDWARSAPLYPLTLQILFTTFWARLSWGQIGLGPLVDAAVSLVVLGSAVGLLLRAWWRDPELPLWQRRWIWLCLVAFVCAWLVGVGRLHPLPPPDATPYLPRGRYLFWAILPTLWLLALGWQGALPTRWRPAGLQALVAALALLDLLAIVAVAMYYQLA